MRDGRPQRRDEIKTTRVGSAVKDRLGQKWLGPYGSVEPGTSALLEKSGPDCQIAQFTYLLWVVSSPKKRDCFQRAEVDAHKAETPEIRLLSGG